MHRRAILSALTAFAMTTGSTAQTTTANPLDSFISAVQSVAGVVETNAPNSPSSSLSSSSPVPTTPSSTSATSSPTSSSLPASGLSSRTELIIIVVAIVVGLLLLALLAGFIYYCCRRRRKRRNRQRLEDDDVQGWRHPLNPNHGYVDPNVTEPPMSQQPTVPLMGTAARPGTEEHPAHRHENPFVPVPPPSRKTAPNARAGLTDGMVHADPAYIPDRNSPRRLRKSLSQSRSTSGIGLNDAYSDGYTREPLPTHQSRNRPPTPLGFGTLLGGAHHGNDSHHDARYSGIGEPYSDRHVSHLNNANPSDDLRNSPYDPIPNHFTSQSTPSSAEQHGINSYSSNESNNTSLNSWHTSQMGQVPTPPPNAPWEDRERRWSGENRVRSYSQSPKFGVTTAPGQRLSGTSPGGNGRRLRFSDFEEQPLRGTGYSGVGEAM